MLVWINGAFGAGKTQTAFELHRRVAHAHVADPELIGIAIHRMLPASARGDFQDRPQWRSAVIATLTDVVAAHPGVTIVPMTLVVDRYFDEIMTGLATNDVDVRHFCLTASPRTLRGRLASRGGHGLWRLLGRDEAWAIAQIDRCTTALAGDRYAQHIDTDALTVDEVVETIAAAAGLELSRPRLTRIRYQVRRAGVGLQHIRL